MRRLRGGAMAVATALLCAPVALALAQSHVRADEAMAALQRKDCPTAIAALRQGMADNEPMAFYISGTLAETGTCAEADPASAAKAYERAALLGNRDAASSLALLYAEGSGVAQSWRDAGRWYAIASGASMSSTADTALYERVDSIAKTYVYAVHDLADFELANRLKYPYPTGVRVRFDPRSGVAAVVGRVPGKGPREVADRDILSSYAEAIRMLPKPELPASGDYATEHVVGAPNGS